MVLTKFFSFISKLFPVRFISTVCYVGYLPEWKRYWAAFFGYVTISVAILIHAAYLKLSIFNIYIPKNMVILMSPILFFAVFLTLLSIFSIFLYKLQEGIDDTTIVIDAFVGAIWMVILTFPGIMSLRDFGYSTVNLVCRDIFECTHTPYNILGTIMMIALPLFMFCMIDKFKFWPSEKIIGNFDGAFSRISDVLISAIYCCIFIYLFAFMVMKMPLNEVVEYYKGIFGHLDEHLIALFTEFRFYIEDKDLKGLVEKIKK